MIITIAYILLAISALTYASFWIWGMIHAYATPKTEPWQRALWVAAMIVNPSAIVWYWYVWKRWVFWILFTPMLGLFISLPIIVSSSLSRQDANAATNFLSALGAEQVLTIIACLMIFPLILRLVALLHLGRNNDLSAMNRNDWVVSRALPIFGFGAGFAFCAKYKRNWALVSLVWWVAIALSSRYIWNNVSHELISVGEERRTELRALQTFDRGMTPN